MTLQTPEQVAPAVKRIAALMLAYDRRALLAESDEGLWNALKQQCCADPPNAVRCVMVTKEDFLAALRRHHAISFQAGWDAAQIDSREKVAAMMLRLSIATGHGDTLDDLLIELEGQLKEIMR